MVTGMFDFPICIFRFLQVIARVEVMVHYPTLWVLVSIEWLVLNNTFPGKMSLKRTITKQLEFEVVTPDGELRIANRCQNKVSYSCVQELCATPDSTLVYLGPFLRFAGRGRGNVRCRPVSNHPCQPAS